jgi:hypothetical protein
MRLEKYTDYSRRMVHALFSPQTKFTPQAGTWGLQGIVNLYQVGDFDQRRRKLLCAINVFCI